MPATEPAIHYPDRHDHDAASPGLATDPVCGMSVDPATARHRTEHAGKQYFFCGPRCLERFTAEPERFVGVAKPAASVASGATGWTCPMHPEIIRDGPGSCPICGMALEPMDVFAEVEADPEYDSMRLRFWVSAALSVPVLLLSMFGESFGLHLRPAVLNGIEFLLATPVVLWGGWPFFE